MTIIACNTWQYSGKISNGENHEQTSSNQLTAFFVQPTDEENTMIKSSHFLRNACFLARASAFFFATSAPKSLLVRITCSSALRMVLFMASIFLGVCALFIASNVASFSAKVFDAGGARPPLARCVPMIFVMPMTFVTSGITSTFELKNS